MRLNTLVVWPHVHLCLLDWSCWRELWECGSPPRLYYRRMARADEVHDPDGYTYPYLDIPGLKQLAAWRWDRLWGDEETAPSG